MLQILQVIVRHFVWILTECGRLLADIAPSECMEEEDPQCLQLHKLYHELVSICW